MIDYRVEAEAAFERAKAEIESNDDERLKYAAVELRMVMEALTYELAAAYGDAFPKSEYGTWHPKKVMECLLSFDGDADKTREVYTGFQSQADSMPEKFWTMGEVKPVSLLALKTY